MKKRVALKGKRILAVDDEYDILESIQEVLEGCDIDTAQDYQTAVEMLNANVYDLAVLDIMGVLNYDLLKIAKSKKVRAVMLTSHALSSGNFAKSMGGGADVYLPKNKRRIGRSPGRCLERGSPKARSARQVVRSSQGLL